jgi:hypothetical protein
MYKRKDSIMKKWFMLKFYRWLLGWAKIVDGLVAVLTLGFILTDFGYKMSIRCIKVDLLN